MGIIERLSPLPQRFQRMKAEYQSAFRQQGFKGYRSPWLPLTRDNASLVDHGALVICPTGAEIENGVGRKFDVVCDGKTKASKMYYDGAVGDKPVTEDGFVWVDSRKQDSAVFLEGNPKADAYHEYSGIMEQTLRQAHEQGLALIEPVQFPLWHETSRVFAESIKRDGFDMLEVWDRIDTKFRGYFSACLSYEATLGKGNSAGAMVKLMPSPTAHPNWINHDVEQIRWLTESLDGFIYRFGSRGENNFYDWGLVCAELSVSAVNYGFVHIMHSFDQFAAVEVIDSPVNTTLIKP